MALTAPDNPVLVNDAGPETVTRRQRILASLLTAAAFLAAYVLSAGPMAGLARAMKFRPFTRCLEIFYGPLALVIKIRLEPFASLLEWYASLFR